MKYKLKDNQSNWYQDIIFYTKKDIKNSLLYRLDCAGELDDWTETEIKNISLNSLLEITDFELLKIK